MQERVLLATSTETQRRLARALEGFRLVFAANAAEVRAALAGRRFDLIVVGARFDESQSLEVLQEIQRTQHGARVVCVRGTPTQRVGRSSLEAFRLACEALGAPLVLNLLDYGDDEAGDEAIRELFESHLSAT